ncbi:MAG: MBL fold metallo-hydrolase [Candidatus Dojkabacteria bacterium]|nr:MBL fold metallo-hydrolase [Candidatus Dojkabacteria bacterium]
MSEIINKILYKKLYFPIILSVFLIVEILVFISFDDLLSIEFLDVGQGDSCLIRTPGNKYILVDAGEDETVLSELGEVVPFWITKIDIFIGTHADSDHIKGFLYVLDKYEVDVVLVNDLEVEDQNLCRIKEVANAKGTRVIEAVQGDTFRAGDFKADILWPPEDQLSELDDNQKSIVVSCKYNQFSFLLTGDIESDQEMALIEQNVRIGSEILKLPHHGSKTASSYEFLRYVDPDVVIISCGLDNKFSHPHAETIDKLDNLGIHYYRTDKQGRIGFRTNGQNYRVMVEK